MDLIELIKFLSTESTQSQINANIQNAFTVMHERDEEFAQAINGLHTRVCSLEFMSSLDWWLLFSLAFAMALVSIGYAELRFRRLEKMIKELKESKESKTLDAERGTR